MPSRLVDPCFSFASDERLTYRVSELLQRNAGSSTKARALAPVLLLHHQIPEDLMSSLLSLESIEET